MANRESNILFDDLFTVYAIDKDGKKFDRVSRLSAKSSNFDMELSLDYNVELYPIYAQDVFSLVLASSLVRDGMGMSDDDANAGWRPDGKGLRGLEEDYDYVMYGKVYKFDESPTSDKTTVYASFGGLLMALTGSFRHLQNIVLGEQVYLLMRR
ncbi:DNA-directed RNA polymerases I, II, and III subunit RPABC3 [Tulasnella sp. 419]|nr:DNA-directed RNA polymerases I, II, and III subunit RPABC3 [Tulasnella sp. 418]KAG8944020.1 DNA-directed RNA polymerases I, II, and III subunit RPABC3 [Tulasnella sp. 419]